MLYKVEDFKISKPFFLNRSHKVSLVRQGLLYSWLYNLIYWCQKRKCDAAQSNSPFVAYTASVSHAYVRLIGQRHASAFDIDMQDLRNQLDSPGAYFISGRWILGVHCMGSYKSCTGNMQCRHSDGKWTYTWFRDRGVMECSRWV